MAHIDCAYWTEPSCRSRLATSRAVLHPLLLCTWPDMYARITLAWAHYGRIRSTLGGTTKAPKRPCDANPSDENVVSLCPSTRLSSLCK